MSHALIVRLVSELLFLAGPAIAQAPAQAATDSAATEKAAAAQRQLSLANKPWTGDFDKMLERRMIRVYAPYSRSLYFNDKGRERGLSAELIRDFERWLNKKYAKQLGRIGIETTTYVRNIYKYYVAYKLTMDAHAVAEKARQQVAPAKG